MTDRAFFVIHAINSYLVETSEQEVLSDIEQAQICDVVAVYRFNPAEGWAQDYSEDIARAILNNQLNDNGSIGEHVRNFLELHLGCEAVARCEREAA